MDSNSIRVFLVGVSGVGRKGFVVKGVADDKAAKQNAVAQFAARYGITVDASAAEVVELNPGEGGYDAYVQGWRNKAAHAEAEAATEIERKRRAEEAE